MPIFTCISLSLRETLETLGAASTASQREEQAAGDGDGVWDRAAELSEVPNGASKLVYFKGEQVALFNAGGKVYAVSNRCPHANGPLVDGVIEGESVTCPSHGSQFDLGTGEPICGPTSRPLKTFDVRIEGGAIFLTRRAPTIATA